MRGFRVGVDIEFRCRSDVSQTCRPAHERDHPDLFRDPRFHPQRHRDIGERSNRNENDIAVTFHQGPNDIRYRMLFLRLSGQFIENRAVQSALPVDVSGGDLIANQRQGHSAVYLHIQTEMLTYMQRIGKCLVQRLVTRHHRHSQQFNVRMLCCHHQRDRIVMSGITIQDHLDLFNVQFLLIFFANAL